MIDPELIAMAAQIAKGRAPDKGQDSAPNDEAEPVEEAEPVVGAAAPPVLPITLSPKPAKETKTAEELAAMILADLKSIGGCPQHGINVVVYGFNPWNSWLSFAVKAGPVQNKEELQNFCEIITERLKRRYDISMPDPVQKKGDAS